MTIRIGTRASNLAMWQARTVQEALKTAGYDAEVIPFTSMGDRSLGGQLSSSVGQFIHAIDAKLASGEVDIAVHSSKDVPVDVDLTITNLAYLERGSTDDLVLVRSTPGVPSLDEVLANDVSVPLTSILDHFSEGATFGTVSGRRQSFLLSRRPDLIPLAVRGHVETRISRLIDGRVDAIVLAEVGLARLDSTGALDGMKGRLSAFRISKEDWPTAPGQGAIAVHCLTDRFDEMNAIRAVLNHPATEADVQAERGLLKEAGGGCLYPAGIGVDGERVHVQISPENWREIFCQGSSYSMFSYSGRLGELDLQLPQQSLKSVQPTTGEPRYISTLNSDRISLVLSSQGIGMENVPVVDLSPNFDRWPQDFLQNYNSKRDWPYLVLTSPFAAKCAVQAAASNPDIGRIPWVAIGEGTARACFRLGVTVAVCGMARNARQLAAYITENFPRSTTFFLPRSSLASPVFEETLQAAGFSLKVWIGYENTPKESVSVEVNTEDVLVLSSASSAISWAEHELKVPRDILCMGDNALATIESLDHFDGCQVSVLKGPTSEALVKWWNDNRKGD
ncbi:MAG: hydroxymethylbilane synthase [Candidatus Poseidonia sp.]|nr:hydroxymethylbilane synthase [Poseidonia sp.]MBL6885335.1 hydroxymethylbilane synthase [Candidatus Poseidoniaceae archaeon]MBL6886598.1 hydroxymethylbilane synthase [Poseidonia sp.]